MSTDESRPEVVIDVASNCGLLVDHCIGERVVLPQGPAWKLDIETAEEPFVHAEGPEALWASDLLHDQFIEDEAGNVHVLRESGEVTPLWEYQRQHTPISVKISLAEAASAYDLKKVPLEACRHGCLLPVVTTRSTSSCHYHLFFDCRYQAPNR